MVYLDDELKSELTGWWTTRVENLKVGWGSAAKFMEDTYPAWTAVGVTELILPNAVVENQLHLPPG